MYLCTHLKCQFVKYFLELKISEIEVVEKNETLFAANKIFPKGSWCVRLTTSS
jgi:hypothetical protein